MASRSRRRKAEKRRRHERPPAPGANRVPPQPPVRELVYAAVAILHAPRLDAESYRRVLTLLAERGERAEVEVDVMVSDAVTQVRRRNWSSAEVARQAGRRLGPQHARYVGERMDGTVCSAGVLAVAVEVLALLLRLPPLPKLGPPAAAPRRPQNARVLEKVRALLAKAESTTFPEEAEALSAKAQELMARHAIDEAMVGGGGPAADAPAGIRLPVDDPYASPKSILLSEVAAANGCRAVWSRGHGFSTVVGFDADLEFVELLYTSLLVQATTAMVATGSQVDRSGRSRTRSFRQAFLLAYATRIGHRLREAEAASRASAAEAYGEALVPVLADRSAAVSAAEAAAFPHVSRRSVTVSNAAGWAAGNAAADLASLTGRAEVSRHA